MKIIFTKLSDERHRLRIVREDGTSDAAELETRSMLLHDLAHYALEGELGLSTAVWGACAAGASLGSEEIEGADLMLAESIAGPLQILMRDEASPAAVERLLTRLIPERSSPELAERVHARMRSLRGHWRATPYQGDMVLHWPPPST